MGPLSNDVHVRCNKQFARLTSPAKNTTQNRAWITSERASASLNFYQVARFRLSWDLGLKKPSLSLLGTSLNTFMTWLKALVLIVR